MHRIQIKLSPYEATNSVIIREKAAKYLGTSMESIGTTIVRKRAIDARQKNIIINLTVDVYFEGEKVEENLFEFNYKDISSSKTVVVVGAGPCGLFASLRLIELGLKPILLERGKDVISRRRDISNIERSGIINKESNYGFGEGGAGAFSDGKLYTRSKKRGSVDRILEILCRHGADRNILIDSHPHIGTDKLPKIIKQIRERIISCGAEVYFDTRVSDIIVENNIVRGVRCSNGMEYVGPVILATGHSARDIYSMLHSREILMLPKPLAVGLRIEHPQILIDQIRYHNIKGRGKYLPAAEYVYKTQIDNRGVYSFCMCPGGFIVPASTGDNQQVVNGMSPSNRGSKWANSGMVVEVRPDDLYDMGFSNTCYSGVLSMMHFCESLEYKSFIAAGNSLRAPAQRLTDFINKRMSASLPSSSYSLGLESSNISEWLPSFISDRLIQAFKVFDRTSKGFLTCESQVLAVESRTSSPVRIPRDPNTLSHIEVNGLFPSGEGAGYAGGIVSAAIDGERSAEAVSEYLKYNL